MRSSEAAFTIRAAVLAGGLLLVSPALGQNAPTPITPNANAPVQNIAPPPAADAAPPSRPVEKPGLFEAIGRWIDGGKDSLSSHLRGAKRKMDTLGDDAAENSREIGSKAVDIGKGAVEVTKGAVEVTKGAVDSVAKLPVTRVMSGHERCGVAANGAPDCLVAAEALCRKHGFSSGKSMDFTSAEECTAQTMLSGRQSENDCRTVTFISRAMCQ